MNYCGGTSGILISPISGWHISLRGCMKLNDQRPMSHSDPFPAVTRLAKECRAKWAGYERAAKATKAAEAKLHKALIAGMPGGRFLDSDSSLVICGSFARHEMTDESDYDWTLLIDGVVNNQHAEFTKDVLNSLRSAGLVEPGSSGTFGNLVFSHDLVHRIGGGADSNLNLTRRMLMLLESKPVYFGTGYSSPHVWNNVMTNILERYFEQDVHFSVSGKCRVPRFLLNDLTRYWRTICVDYAAKHREQDGKKWALRNAKLRLSRKLIYASGLAFCLSCELDPPQEDSGLFADQFPTNPQEFIASAMRFAQTPSLEFLAAFVNAFVKEPAKRQRVATLIFGSYNEWLLMMADKEIRASLETLSHDNAKGDVNFEKVRRVGEDFAKGLQLLFFNREGDGNDPIANLSLDYVGF